MPSWRRRWRNWRRSSNPTNVLDPDSTLGRAAWRSLRMFERGAGHAMGAAVLPSPGWAGGAGAVRKRWVRVGLLTTEHYIERGNSGFPNGFKMFWAGRQTNFFEPREFRSWPEVKAAVVRRLLMAGLHLESWAVGWPPRRRQTMWHGKVRELEILGEVRRASVRFYKRNRRELVNPWVRSSSGSGSVTLHPVEAESPSEEEWAAAMERER